MKAALSHSIESVLVISDVDAEDTHIPRTIVQEGRSAIPSVAIPLDTWYMRNKAAQFGRFM